VFERMAMAHQQEQQMMQFQQLQQQQSQVGAPGGYGGVGPAVGSGPQAVPYDVSQNTAQDQKKKKPVNTQATTPAPIQPVGRGGATGTAPGGQPNGFFGMFFSNNDQQAPGQPIGQAGVLPQQPALPPKSTPVTTGKTKARRPASGSRTSGDGGTRGMGGEKLSPVPTTIKSMNTPTDKEKFEIELIQSLLVSYFNIVRKNVGDTVPKSIMHFLVNQAKDNIQNELVTHLYKEELFDELLEESPAVGQRRKACKQMLEVLRRAQGILAEVRDTSL